MPVHKENGADIAHGGEKGYQIIVIGLMDKDEDHQSGEELDGHRTDGDGGHLFQPPVHEVGEQGVGAHGDQIEEIHQHLTPVCQRGTDKQEEDQERKGHKQGFRENDTGEDFGKIGLVLPESGNLGGSGIDKAKVDENLEKVSGILGGAQHADSVQTQHPHLISLGQKPQSHVGELENVEHYRVFQKASPAAGLPFLFQVHSVSFQFRRPFR